MWTTTTKINTNLRLNTTQSYSVKEECRIKNIFQLKFWVGYNTKLFGRGGVLRNKKKYKIIFNSNLGLDTTNGYTIKEEC
jgi:hypothetical protein